MVKQRQQQKRTASNSNNNSNKRGQRHDNGSVTTPKRIQHNYWSNTATGNKNASPIAGDYAQQQQLYDQTPSTTNDDDDDDDGDDDEVQVLDQPPSSTGSTDEAYHLVHQTLNNNNKKKPSVSHNNNMYDNNDQAPKEAVAAAEQAAAEKKKEKQKKNVCALDSSDDDDDDGSMPPPCILNNPLESKPNSQSWNSVVVGGGDSRPRRGPAFAAANNGNGKNYSSRNGTNNSNTRSNHNSSSSSNINNALSNCNSNSNNNNNNTRNTRYNNSNNNSQKNKKVAERIPHANERILDELIQQAEFELQHDPYRGMMMMLDDDGDTATSSGGDTVDNPWNVCQATTTDKYRPNRDANKDLILNIEDCTKHDMDGTGLATAWVEEACQCHCPSLLQWTRASIVKDRQQAAKERKRTKKQRTNSSDSDNNTTKAPPQVGQRPDDPQARFPCDYNPFCTASLGGVANILWQDTTNRLYDTKKQQHENLEAMIEAQNMNRGGDSDRGSGSGGGDENRNNNNNNNKSTDPEPMVIDYDNPPRKNKQQSKNDDDNDDEVIVVSGSTTTVSSNSSKKSNSCQNDVAVADIDYASETAEELKKIRRSTLVKTQPILDHLEYLLSQASGKLAKKMTIEDLLQIFTRWQSSLIFSNPLRDDLKATSDMLPVALPPGISNLGATCYLNTQLQCLAQNKAFLKGIISWRPAETNPDGVEANDNNNNDHNKIMNSVLTELQALLVQLVEGSQRTVTTLAFSTALGLENDEQQDPNEFARLLFEQMHESFKQHPSLRQLLPSLFEGSTTYDTRCLACKTVSTRSESFMDLNLPIVQPPKEEDDDNKKQKGVVGKMYHFFSKATGKEEDDSASLPNAHADTDLQYCLDKYSTHEKLEGDNQYFCGNCGCKQDAVRETSLGTLPPVLNIQLSRYVFDMKTFTKKKLTDKVLLPRMVRVNTKTSDAAGDAFSTKNYVLCAVMKHQGNSAYRGHYVAEVQDFLTGQWYEFNDEKVTLLEKGPSCSYVPSKVEETDDDGDVKMVSPEEAKASKRIKKRSPKLEGSPDAYNMYYVEESFMAKKTLEAFQMLKEQLEELDASIAKKGKTGSTNILQTVAYERHSLHRQLSELCIVDGRAAERLTVRRNRLRSEVFSSRLQGRSSKRESMQSTEQVWVDAELLRKFVSCKDRLQDLMMLPAGHPLLQHQHLLCQHPKPGLHPRIARRGKLLSASFYGKYISIFEAERCLYLGDDRAPLLCKSNTDALWTSLNDCIISPGNNLHCEECSASYKTDLNSKLVMVKLLRRCYAHFDPKNQTEFYNPWSIDDDDFDWDEDHSRKKPDEYAFVVPKTFITAFRKKIEMDLLKGLSLITETTANSPAPVTVSICDEHNEKDFNTCEAARVPLDSLSEGLDALDLSKFRFDGSNKSCGLDPKINSSITCAHGNCTDTFTKNKVMWLKQSLWNTLKTVFPDAIGHKVLWTGDGKTGKRDDRCTYCDQEQRSKNNLEEKLVQWFDQAHEQALKNLYKQPKVDSAIEEIFGNHLANSEQAENYKKYVAVAKSDLILWRNLLKLVGKLKRKLKGVDGHTLRKELESLLLKKEKDWMKHASDPSREPFLVALRCTRHDLTAPVFQRHEKGSNVQLSPSVQLLDATVYDALLASIVGICTILAHADSKEEESDSTEEESGIIDLAGDSNSDLGALLKRSGCLELGVIATCYEAVKTNSKAIFLELPQIDGSSGPDPVCLALSKELCDDEKCCQEFCETLKPEKEAQNAYGSAADAPIVLDEADEQGTPDTFYLKVFEIEVGTSNDRAILDLLEMQAIPTMTGEPSVADDSVRRSTRKRKARFPHGSILRSETVSIAIKHNVAAIRLLLMQSCVNFKLNQNLTLVFAPGGCIPVEQSSADNDSPQEQRIEPRLRDLPFESNEKVLSDIYVSLADDSTLQRLGDPTSTLFFLRESKPDEKGGNDAAMDAALMDGLLEQANTIAKENEPKNGKKKSAERGFQGTMLFRSAPVIQGRLDAITEDAMQAVGDEKEGDSSSVSNGTLLADEANCDSKSSPVKAQSKPREVSILERLPIHFPDLVKHLQDMTGVNDTKARTAAKWVVDNNPQSVSKDDLYAAGVTRVFQINSG